jgi:hypothetical protein
MKRIPKSELLPPLNFPHVNDAMGNLEVEVTYAYRIQGIAKKFWTHKHQTLLYLWQK